MSMKSLTKRERKEQRKQENLRWKNVARKDWNDVDPNPRHSGYFLTQFPDWSSEWKEIQGAFSTPLMSSFWVVGGNGGKYSLAGGLGRRLVTEFMSAKGHFIEIDGKIIDNEKLVKFVQWCDAWQVATDSSHFAKVPAFEKLHSFVCREVELGHIVRQELVSMLPGILIQAKEHHRILDMCASPGSKSQQLQSNLSHYYATQSFADDPKIPSGLLVANDADPKRIDSLVARFARSATPNLIITCSRGEQIPVLMTDSHHSSTVPSSATFDRIVCDVPCSGDGTFRKCPHLWRLFRPRAALELHPLQLNLAETAISLLKPGGRLVYSTCSINPIEDEAVVAALLQRHPQDLTLVDISGSKELYRSMILPGCHWRRGISAWHCDMETLLSGEIDEGERRKSASMMPPILPSMQSPSEDIAQALHLDRCIRILPHDQDTGGFFVAVLEKRNKLVPLQLDRHVECPRSSSVLASDEVLLECTSSGVDSKSRNAMKRLGYNPKMESLSLTSAQTTDIKQLETQSTRSCRFRDIPPIFAASIELVLGINPTAVDMNYFGSSIESDRSSKPVLAAVLAGDPEGLQTEIDNFLLIILLSRSVAEAIRVWADPIAKQVGVRVAALDIRAQRWTFQPDYCKYLRAIASPARVITILPSSFVMLAGIASMQASPCRLLFSNDGIPGDEEFTPNIDSEIPTIFSLEMIAALENIQDGGLLYVAIKREDAIVDGSAEAADDDTTNDAGSKKRRLSKAEKKRLLKQQKSSSSAVSSIDGRVENAISANPTVECSNSFGDMVIVLSVHRPASAVRSAESVDRKRNGRKMLRKISEKCEIQVSVLTPTDRCASYAAALECFL